MDEKSVGLNPLEIPVTPEEDEMFAERKSFADILTEWENRSPEPGWRGHSYELGELDENGEIHEISLVREPLQQEELMNWWVELGHKDAQLVTQKYQEYGNTALLEVGQQLADVMGREVNKAEAQELGIWFFMVGKMARWKTALLRGVSPSKDTLDDLAVYATMARRVHEKGGWPNA